MLTTPIEQCRRAEFRRVDDIAEQATGVFISRGALHESSDGHALNEDVSCDSAWAFLLKEPRRMRLFFELCQRYADAARRSFVEAASDVEKHYTKTGGR